MKRKALMLSIVLFCLVAVLGISAFAENYPSISKDKYIEFKAQESLSVYKDTACKTRGTSSPAKVYNASISTGDTCYIYKITDSYVQINYPTSSGRRTGYVKRSALFDKKAPVTYIASSKAKVTVYKSSSGSCVAKGDKVWHVDPKKGYSGYKAVIYEAKSGKRAYKMGYITVGDLDKVKGIKASITNTSSNVKFNRVDEFNNSFYTILLSSVESARKTARNTLDIVLSAESTLAIERTLGTGIGAVAYLNPKKMVDVISFDSMVGLAALTASNSIYETGEVHYAEFLKKSKNVKTAAQADAAVKCGIEALAYYSAVINEHWDTIERYTKKGNYTLDKLEAFLSSACESLVPGSEYKKIMTVCKGANSMATVLETAADFISQNSGARDARNRWNKAWNEYIELDKLY